MKKMLKCLTARDYIFMVLIIGLVVVQVWLELTMPDYTSSLTTAVSAGTATMDDVWQNGGMMLLCAAGSMVASIICTYFCASIAADFAKNLRRELFAHIMNFSNKEINQFSIPSLITRTTNDVVQLQNIVSIGVQLIFKAPILAIWAICKISNTSTEWTLATAICVIVLVIFVGIIIALAIPKFKKIQKLTDDLNDNMRENITGVRVVRAFNAEEYQEEKFEKTNKEVMKNNLFTARVTGLMSPFMTIAMNALTLAIYWIGAYLIDAEETLQEKAVVLGQMTAFSSYALQIVMAFMMLIAIFIFLPRAAVSFNRIKAVLNTDISIVDSTEPVEAVERGTVEFKNVSFSYNDADHLALTDISFKINQGETVAIIGATGSSKSTLINLISRFYDTTSGEVLVDGVNVKDYNLNDLHNKVAVATQKAVLFKGNVRDNVLFGEDTTDKTEEDAKEALKIAHADFVLDNPEGLDLRVAQGGKNFSGGQKQRLSIARTVCKGSEIMIFDDSFSALDYKTDSLIRKDIKEKLDATVIIIAQRVGTIKNCDKIIVLDEGKIVGMGKHDELIANCPIYKDIALSQLSKEEI